MSQSATVDVAGRSGAIDAPDIDAPVIGGRARARRRMLRPVLMLGGIAVVIVASGYFWLQGGRWVSVDDSYVEAAKLAVSTDVSGIVSAVAVKDGQQVAKGQLLFRLDPKPFLIALAGARAKLAQTVLDLDAAKQDYQRMLGDVSVRQAQVQSDQASFDRFSKLVRGGGVTRSEYDDARFKLAADQASVAALQTQAKVQLAKLGGDAQGDVTKLPQYLVAQAQVDEAQRQLGHTEVHAPFAGVVTQVDTVQPGMYLSAATSAFGLVSSTDVWVDANPKETDLTYVKPGDPVSLSIDSYPGHDWKARVAEISPASGSEFSVLPAQNSSGNWVKVVQRIPLRVQIDHQPGDPPLRAGMSALVDIDTGHTRSLSDLVP